MKFGFCYNSHMASWTPVLLLLFLCVQCGSGNDKVAIRSKDGTMTNSKSSSSSSKWKGIPFCGDMTSSSSSAKKCRSGRNKLSRKEGKKISNSNNNLINVDNITIDKQQPPNYTIDMKSLAKSVIAQRRKCKNRKNSNNAKTYSFTCLRLDWSGWLMRHVFEPETTRVLSPWVELTRNPELEEENNNDNHSESALEVDNNNSNWVEKGMLRFLQKYGGSSDILLFLKAKEWVKSRELRVKVPHLMEVKVAPRTHYEGNYELAKAGSGARIFWDPGFNLKLKFPFFKDELKVAISTGPAFLVGIGTGIVLLIIKSMFAPLIIGMKYMFYNVFWKEGSPWDVMKTIWSPGGGGHHHHEGWESALPPPSIEHFEPALGFNHYDNHVHNHGNTGHGWGWNTGDQKLQFSQLNPLILQGLGGGGSSSSSEGRRQQHFKGLLLGNHGDLGGGGTTGTSEDMSSNHIKEYVPSHALQAEVENYDPFYSPLLSRIDSIFMHLGYHDEGCRERAVCSIYKFPVKYAPYSNLLSAQLSKHQTELKRPITKSPRILRYFKYMKAAKDGQGQGSCIQTYPNCDQDTDSVTNLPMITTFNQLSELMGAEANGATGSS